VPSGKARRHNATRVLVLASAVLSALAGCVESSPSPLPGNLLVDLPPSASVGVTHPERLSDGLAPTEGDFWLTGITARLASPRARVTWDLGAPKPIRCVMLQGDNNDSYRLATSDDGKEWEELWVGGPVNGAGMRVRTGNVERTARYLRLMAEGGDGSYSVGEMAIFSTCPAGWPELKLARADGVPINKSVQNKLWLFCALAALFVLVHRRGGRWQYPFGAAALLAGGVAVLAVAEIYPFANSDEESIVRAVVAIIAGVLVLKEAFFKESAAPDPRVARAIQAVLAVAALGCYYHFASLQFHDVAKGRRTLVHTWDMRNYFPTVKYFRELRFDGLYLGSLAAYLDNVGDPTGQSVRSVHLRDLSNYEMITGEQAMPQLPALRARFSPERWEEFKRDMKYFLDTMGRDDYLGSMQDHGGNATPVWLIAAWAIFRNAPASELSLTLAGLIDPLLLLVFFFVLYRSFGLRVMLYTVILFGATDFYQFGSNLMGSTLRQDWLVAIGLGACAIKGRRPFLGGFLMAYGGLIRAFPSLAALFLVAPVAWWLFGWWREHRRLPPLRTLREAQRPALRAIGGAAAAVMGLFLLSTALFGYRDAWVTWSKKIEMHAVGPSTNNVGLRNLLAFRPWTAAREVIRKDLPEPWEEWQRLQVKSFGQLRPVFYLLNLLAFALTMLACRGRPAHQTGLLGLLMIPFLFYPSNYYCHFVFLLPMALAVEGPAASRDRNFAWAVAVLCAMCVGQYFTYAEGWGDLRYTWQSFVLLIGFVAIMIPLALQGWRDLRASLWPPASPSSPAEPPPPASPPPAAATTT
jgi:hypothetical protein